MSKNFYLVVVTAFLASCAMSIGGSGSTTKGEPLVAEASREQGDLSNITIRIQSPNGMDCSGSYSKDAFKGSTVSFLLECRDGRKGNALLTKSSDGRRADVAFTLNDKKKTSGSLKLGGV